jgi:hypothetical protein
MAQRWEQARHQGVPLVFEIMSGPNLALMAQIIDFEGRQVAQVGPSVPDSELQSPPSLHSILPHQRSSGPQWRSVGGYRL